MISQQGREDESRDSDGRIRSFIDSIPERVLILDTNNIPQEVAYPVIAIQNVEAESNYDYCHKELDAALKSLQADLLPTDRSARPAGPILNELCHPLTAIIALTQACLRRLKHDEPDIELLTQGLNGILVSSLDAAQILRHELPGNAVD